MGWRGWRDTMGNGRIKKESMTVFPAWPFRTLPIWLTFPTAMSNVHYSARVAECLQCSPRQ